MLLKEKQTVSNRFEVLSLLGRGGMAEVYLARDLRLGGEICLKTLLPHLRSDPLIRARFEREVAAVRGLDHPNIVRIFELLEDGELLYFTMQHLPGSDLKRRIRRHGALPLAEIVSIGQQVAAALGAAHEQGIVHRDVKPQNVLVSAEGSVKLVDFGLAHMISLVGVSLGSMSFGTPLYSAPELLSGSVVDPRADLYSLGVLLHEMATGQLPFSGAGFYDLLRRQIEEPPPALRSLRPELPPWLESLVATALAKDPEERFQTAEELREALMGGADTALASLAPRPAGVPAIRPEPPGLRCPRCSSAYLPFATMCLECGYEPLTLREGGRGPYLLVLEGLSSWSTSRIGVRPGRDPLTYEQKWRLVSLLQELCGPSHVPVEEMDLRLRALPAVLFDHLGYDAALALKSRFDPLAVPTSIRHRLSPRNVGLLADQGHAATLLAMMLLSVMLFVSLPFFNLGLTLAAGFGAMGLGFLVRLGTLRPLGRLPRGGRLVDEAPALAERCRQVLPRLRSVRLRKLVRKILGRYAAIHTYLGGSERPALRELRAELPGLEELGGRALGLAESIQHIENALGGLREGELVEAVQSLDVAIDEEQDPERADALMRERLTQVRALEGLREGERALSALYGDLIRTATALGGWLGRIGSVDGQLEAAQPELPRLLQRLEDRARSATEALDGIAPPSGPPAAGLVDAWHLRGGSANGLPSGPPQEPAGSNAGF